jgi:hypothetical protein
VINHASGGNLSTPRELPEISTNVNLLRLKIYTPAVADATDEVLERAGSQYPGVIGGVSESAAVAHDSAFDAELSGEEKTLESATRSIAPWATSSPNQKAAPAVDSGTVPRTLRVLRQITRSATEAHS